MKTWDSSETCRSHRDSSRSKAHRSIRRPNACSASLTALLLALWVTRGTANPVGGTVSQGAATITSQGPQLTIQTSDRTQINWSSFNIGVGETTTFVQPSSSSVVWNRINDTSASQLLGTLNANGYVVLQNSSGFYIGGQAVLSAHGLVLTTSPMPVPDLSSAGAWQFNALPPTASIINYGQLRQPDGDKGGSVFLIAADIQNQGTISAPQGQIRLYAGKEVLVSTRPDGRGLSARVTLPQGSVDNHGQLLADAGTIAMQAQVVNQGGLLQANSVRNANGVIELLAGDSLNLDANSSISAAGDAAATSASQGGFVIAKSDGTFADTATSALDISGKNGGRNGVVEVFGTGTATSTIQSLINGQSAASFQSGGGWLMVNPQDIMLSSSVSTPSASSPNLQVSDLSTFSKIDLFAGGNIKLTANWTLASSDDIDARLTLNANNSITLSSSLIAVNNWNVDMSAGPGNLAAKPQSGDGIYLNGSSFIQTQNGSIDLWAANEVLVNPGIPYPGNTGAAGNNGIRTLGGGSISVTAQYGDVNTGGNYNGFTFGQVAAPYYKVSKSLGGISTYAGGDVSISAGRNVTSYLPVQSDYLKAQYDGGTGAFGAQPGNVTINAGGNVSGHYVLVDGIGNITAGGDIGAPTSSGGFALSLVKGSWNVSTPGSLYLQDVRNPNGVFDDYTYAAGYHVFDYDPLASLALTGKKVEITGAGAPHGVVSAPGSTVPMLFPPSLRVNAGSDGFVLDTDVILFPSANGEMHIASAGDFKGYEDPGDPTLVTIATLSMSDSAAKQWLPNSTTFGLTDHAPVPPELDNPNPVEVSVGGDMKNVVLRTSKATHIDVQGNMYNASFLGQNLHPADVTYIDANGQISYPPVYTFVDLAPGEVISSPESTFSTSWDAIFSLLVNPNVSLEATAAVLAMTPRQQTAYAWQNVRWVLRDSFVPAPGYDPNSNPGFIYDANSGRLGYAYQMSPTVYNALNKSAIPIVKLDPRGNVIIEQHDDGKYYFATTTASFVYPYELDSLNSPKQPPVKDAQSLPPGFQIGGPGQLNIRAASLNLGSSSGIISWGIASGLNPVNYSTLAPWTPSGASLKVDVGGDISLLTSTIASIYGGNVTVNSGGGVSLSQGNFALIPPGANMTYGIFTAGNSDVSVTAEKNIEVGGARIAAFNGGDVLVRSEAGNVNAGNGAKSLLVVPVIRLDPEAGQMVSDTIQDPRPFGSGIIALAPTANYQAPGINGLPGNITIETPNGDIISTLGGIQQFALNGSVAGGPTITLSAGTASSEGSPGHVGNVDLGQGGVVGGTINISAQGSIKGLIVSRQNANINAAQSFSGTLLSGGTANVNASAGGVSGTIIGVSGVNASGGAGVTAAVMGQNVSIGGGAAQSTLGTTAAATSTSQAAAQQASSDAQQQLAKDSSQNDDDKKKRINPPMLVKRVGRVTVILPENQNQ